MLSHLDNERDAKLELALKAKLLTFKGPIPVCDFFKHKHQPLFQQSNERVRTVQRMVKEHTGLEAEEYGFGVGSVEIISGSATSNGHKKGEADLLVKSVKVFIEVTGTYRLLEPQDRNIWIRPDKIEAAMEAHKKGYLTWVVHAFPRCGEDELWSAVRLDERFFRRYTQGLFIHDHPNRYGSVKDEDFVSIPITDSFVKPMEALYDDLRNTATR